MSETRGRTAQSRCRRDVARAFPAAIALVVGLVAPSVATAQSAVDQYTAAIREQREAIASNRASRARCGVPGDPRCAALDDRARLMADNLARLERQHARMGGSAAARAPEPSRFAAPPPGMAPRGRFEPPPGVQQTYQQPAPQQRSLFSILFEPRGSQSHSAPYEGGSSAPPPRTSGVTIYPGDGDPNGTPTAGSETTIGGAGAWSGNYRTLCVRTCDGFYFPVTFNASRARMKTDANVCKALCPAAETRLYYHDATGQEAEDAVAADDGTPISKLPNAFVYRTKVVSNCSCGAPDLKAIPTGAGGLLGTREARAGIDAGAPLPRIRPAPDQDPETQALRLSGLDIDDVAPLSPASPEAAAKIAETGLPEAPKVRTVGPKYFSDR